MFKLESYITPIILSYVNRYIKNFDTDDSRVSLWGGEAIFNNLDLRLDVLEEELQLPFNIVSGHIHQLVITVPWTKLTSEPIKITINTIECVLKLKGSGDVPCSESNASVASGSSSGSKDGRKKQKRQETETPPSYLRSIINKIVNNISIICTNVILKYVEEDIVLSVNVKNVYVRSANERWQPAFTDFLPSTLMIRKLIELSDVTICLDKRSASGKIDSYLEPILYKSSVEAHVLYSYKSGKAKNAACTRIDVRCAALEFSVSEQQVPMLMRLILLAYTLQRKLLKTEQQASRDCEQHETSMEILPAADSEDDQGDSWAGWAWKFVPSIFPSQDFEYPDDSDTLCSRRTFQAGFYVDKLAFSFKSSECSDEKSYYNSRKCKTTSFLDLHLYGCFIDIVMQGITWLNVQMGISRTTLQPFEDCFCGTKETSHTAEHTWEELSYFSSGKISDAFLEGSLFDNTSDENQNLRRTYVTSWDTHMSLVSRNCLTTRSPVIAVDYAYTIDEDGVVSSEMLSELGSDLEYSDLPEKSQCRIFVGSFVLKVTSGLIHRLQALNAAAQTYDYCSYVSPKKELTREQLPPATTEDYEALQNNIPRQTYVIVIEEPVVQIHLASHPMLELGPGLLFRRNLKSARQQSVCHLCDPVPKLVIKCQWICTKIKKPMYPKRLIFTSCQLPSLPQPMFEACHVSTELKVTGIRSFLSTIQNKQITVWLPTQISAFYEKLLFPQYWIDPALSHTTLKLSTGNVIMTSTKANVMIIMCIASSYLELGSSSDIIKNSTLLEDAVKDKGVEYLELDVNNVDYCWKLMCATSSVIIKVGSVQVFVLQQNELGSKTEQTLVVSGPHENILYTEPFLSITIQTARDPSHQEHPALLVFKCRKMCMCMDPLFWQWLQYEPQPVYSRECIYISTATVQRRRRRTSDISISSPAESLHRSTTPQRTHLADWEQNRSTETYVEFTKKEPWTKEASPEEIFKESIIEILTRWFPVWSCMVLNGDIESCVVYLPSKSISAVGVQSIHEAVENCLKNGDDELSVVVITLPKISLRNANQRTSLHQFTSDLPIILPETLWSNGKFSFPWTLVFSEISIKTVQNKNHYFFLKPVSATFTVGIAPKFRSGSVLASLSSDVHIDISPVIIQVSEPQVLLLTEIIRSLMKVRSSFSVKRFKRDLPHLPESPILTNPSPYKESTGSHDSPVTIRQTSYSSDVVNGVASKQAVKMTACIQCTLAKYSMSVYAIDEKTQDHLKLLFDMEDIMTSVDIQQIYLKIICKVASSCIRHFIRYRIDDSWKPGSFGGFVMKVLDDESADEAGSFLSLTFTRAWSNNVHSRWGSRRRSTFLADVVRHSTDTVSSTASSITPLYITELIVKMKALDFILPPALLSVFTKVLWPLKTVRKQQSTQISLNSKINIAERLSNSVLPLMYINVNKIRVIVPVCDVVDVCSAHDSYILEAEKLSLSPQVENPLGRNPVRTDIWRMAEQARMLGIPGSDVEDRQYQLNIIGLCLNTCYWKDLCHRFTTVDTTNLRTMNENPALEWNNLDIESDNIRPHIATLPIFPNINVCVIAAPAVVYRKYTLVCGCSLEVNAISDIQISLSTEQLLLASALCSELVTFLEPLLSDINSVTTQKAEESWMSLPSMAIQDSRDNSTNDFKLSDSGIYGTGSPASSPNLTPLQLAINTKFQSKRSTSNPSVTEQQSLYSSEVKLKSNKKAFSLDKSNLKDNIENENYTNLSGEKDSEIIPIEIYAACPSISFILYECKRNGNFFMSKMKVECLKRFLQRNNLYQSSKEISPDSTFDKASDNMSVLGTVPLVNVFISQPHAFLSYHVKEQKIQMSCYDLSIKTSDISNTIPKPVPQASDFPVTLLETRNGDPHPKSGVLPSFLDILWTCSVGKPSKLLVKIGRPTKLNFSSSRILCFNHIKECILESVYTLKNSTSDGFKFVFYSFHSDEAKFGDLHSFIILPTKCVHTGRTKNKGTFSGPDGGAEIKNVLFGASSVSFSVKQFILVVETTSGTKIDLSIAGVDASANFMSRMQSDRIFTSLNVKSFMITSYKEGVSHLLLNPWSSTISSSFMWENWLLPSQAPKVHLTLISDCLLINVSPDHIKCINDVITDLEALKGKFSSPEEYVCSDNSSPIISDTIHLSSDQHYLDDLRAGAFQFTERANYSHEDLPQPYQVVFWNDPPMMAWRYPQPRSLTRVDVFPVPFKVAYQHLQESTVCRDQVLCSLEYWSECRNTYLPYANFQLSESEVCHLEISDTGRDPAIVACVWRVKIVIQPEDGDYSKESVEKHHKSRITVSPRALAVCMRVDSYFSPHCVPNFQSFINISSVVLRFCSYFSHFSVVRQMPPPLDSFTCDNILPQIQCFATTFLDSFTIFSSSWPLDGQIFELSSQIRLDVVDYAYLTEHTVIEPFKAKLMLELKKEREISVVTTPLLIRFGPATAHTLCAATQLWNQAYQELSHSDKNRNNDSCQVIFSRYVICNDTTRPLRFRQYATEEDILLQPKECHMYSWRSQKNSQLLEIAVQSGSWVWSSTVPANLDGNHVCAFDNKITNMCIIVNVSSLSAAQKMLIFRGQLLFYNILAEHLDCRIKYVDHIMLKDEEFLDVNGQNSSSSVLVDLNKKLTARLKFHGMESKWSGEIPLEENKTNDQPWLVKIPLHDRGQFISIWCRVIKQEINHVDRILVIISPLYMICSYLSSPIQVVIETPGLKVTLDAIIEGRGQKQQLYCPGTIDHSHTLSFMLESSKTVNAQAPLSYAMIDHQKYFKVPNDKAIDIENIIAELQLISKNNWPYVCKEYSSVQWISCRQPLINVQVKYERLGTYCSTLLVSLKPWALIVNSLGSEISLVLSEAKEICKIPHMSVIIPPELENSFYFGIKIEEQMCHSNVLALASLDAGFYIPKIGGLIPATGYSHGTFIHNNTCIFMTISSSVEEDIRIIHVKPKYVVCNFTSTKFEIIPVIVDDVYELPKSTAELEKFKLLIQPLKPDLGEVSRGQPLLKWRLCQELNEDYNSFIIFKTDSNYSCPVKLAHKISRQSFTIPSSNNDDQLLSKPYILTIIERDGQMFILVHEDPHPEYIIHNLCNFKLICAEEQLNDTEYLISESYYYKWCEIMPGKSNCFNVPSYSNRLPETVNSTKGKSLLFGKVNTLGNEPEWSQSIDLEKTEEQFLFIPGHGDVRIKLHQIGYTQHITVENVSDIEISARDIRTRLLKQSQIITTETSHCKPDNIILLGNANSSSCTDQNLEGLSCKCNMPVVLDQNQIKAHNKCEEMKSGDAEGSIETSLVNIMNKEKVNKSFELEETFSNLNISIFVKGLQFSVTDDFTPLKSERYDVVVLHITDLCASLRPQTCSNQSTKQALSIVAGDFQLDNQLFQKGSFDFPVVIVAQTPRPSSINEFCLPVSADELIKRVEVNPMLQLLFCLECSGSSMFVKSFHLHLGPLSAYIEDTFLSKIADHILNFIPKNLIYSSNTNNYIQQTIDNNELVVPVAPSIYYSSLQIAYPLRLDEFVIKPISVQFSLHASKKLYLALDHSSLQFSEFTANKLFTTYYSLGQNVAFHYFVGVLLGVGWVVGSLELLGSPSGFARSVGSGLRDFVNLPYQGIFNGPWDFFAGITSGSASLVRHLTAGTVSSVTKLASSIARNLDRLSLDDEHVQRQEESRRFRPNGLSEGIRQGLSVLGISLLSAVAGIAHQPLQSIIHEGPSPRGLIVGVSQGIVGVLTKPLSGAAEFVALAGQGLLHGAGWTEIPQVRQISVSEKLFYSPSSILKYSWKYLPCLPFGKHQILFVTEATYIKQSGACEPVALVLTLPALVIINLNTDNTQQLLTTCEIYEMESIDPTLLRLSCQPLTVPIDTENASQARIIDYVRSSTGIGAVTNDETQSEVESDVFNNTPPDCAVSEMPLKFYVNPISRKYFSCLLKMIKRQCNGKGFSVM